jgi:hypothetical protein
MRFTYLLPFLTLAALAVQSSPSPPQHVLAGSSYAAAGDFRHPQQEATDIFTASVSYDKLGLDPESYSYERFVDHCKHELKFAASRVALQLNEVPSSPPSFASPILSLCASSRYFRLPSPYCTPTLPLPSCDHHNRPLLQPRRLRFLRGAGRARDDDQAVR